MNDKFIDSVEFMKRFSISQSTLSRGVRDKKPPFSCHVRLGRKIMFPEALFTELAEAALMKAKKDV